MDNNSEDKKVEEQEVVAIEAKCVDDKTQKCSANDGSAPDDTKANVSDKGSQNPVAISGVAYSGGVVRQMFGSAVVDLAGMTFAKQIPLMNTHENTTDSKLGEVSCKIENNKLYINGKITSSSDEAKRIIEDGKRSNWQLSIGAEILSRKLIGEGQTVNVNGVSFKGPIYVVNKSLLREVSVVAIGADKDTDMKIAASFNLTEMQNLTASDNGDNNMSEITNQTEATEVKAASVNENALTPEDIKAATDTAILNERNRISAIRAACNGEYNAIQAKAEEEGWDVNQVNAAIVKEMRENRPTIGLNVNTGVKAVGQNEIEAALCMRLGLDGNDLVKPYGEQTVEAAEKIQDISLKEVMKECIKLSGKSPMYGVGMDERDIQAAFSTVSLPGILSNVANKVMLKAYTAVSPVAPKLCSTGSLVDFKESDRYRLSDLGDLEPIAPDGEIKDGGLVEESAKNQVDTYGKKFCLTRKMIINDDLGAFARIPEMMGAKAARLVDKLFFARLQANPTQFDGKALFHADHNNLGSSAFGKDALAAAISAFENQVDADGSPIAVSPRTLLVPTSLKFTAKELLHSALMVAAGSTDVFKPAYNVLSDENLDIVSSPYLTGNSWYLFGNPSEIDTFEIGYLKGKKTPTIQQGETDYNTLGMWFRIFFDIGVREQDWRGVYKSAVNA